MAVSRHDGDSGPPPRVATPPLGERRVVGPVVRSVLLDASEEVPEELRGLVAVEDPVVRMERIERWREAVTSCSEFVAFVADQLWVATWQEIEGAGSADASTLIYTSPAPAQPRDSEPGEAPV